MKKNYESVIVLNTTGRESDVDQLVQEIGREIEEEGGSLEQIEQIGHKEFAYNCLLYTSPSPRDATLSRMPSSA